MNGVLDLRPGAFSAQVPNVAAWDLNNALKSFTKYVEMIGGSLIALLGVCIMVVALWHVFKKFTSTQPGGGESWGKIAAMVIVGGAMFAAGGWALYVSIAQGGKKTIDDAGNSGFILLDHAVNFIQLPGLFH